MSFQLSRLVVGSFLLSLAAACSAPAEDAAQGELGVSEQALSLDGVAPVNRIDRAADLATVATNPGTFDPGGTGPVVVERHTCDASYCTCTGDPECNDMFSGNDCATGPKSAVCQIRDDVPKCRCTKAAKAD